MQCFTRHRNPDRRLRDDLAIDGNVLLRDGVDCQLRDPYDLKVGGAEGHAKRNPCPLFCQCPLGRPLENADDDLAIVGVRFAGNQDTTLIAAARNQNVECLERSLLTIDRDDAAEGRKAYELVAATRP